MEESFGEEAVKTEPEDLDFSQDDVTGSLEETVPALFVHESQPILLNGEVEQDTADTDNEFVVPSKRKRGPVKKKATKRTKKTIKRATAPRKSKSNNDKHEHNRDLIESTIDSETSSHHHSKMLDEPQDVIIKTDEDNPDHPSVDLPCPPTLQHYTDDEITSAFEQCVAASGKASLKLKIADSDSLFGQVYTVLTNHGKSCLYERQYLHRLWLQKYKPETLKKFSDEQIGTAFLLCYNRKSKLNVNVPNSLFSKVYTFLTENEKSNCMERKYLFDVWTIKYKDALLSPNRLRLSKVGKTSRAKVYKRLHTQRKRDLLLEQAMITQPIGVYPSPELETTLLHDKDKTSPTFPQIPVEQDGKQIRIRVKVEVEPDNDDDYYYEASSADINEDSSIANDDNYEVGSPAPLSPHNPVPDNSEPQQEANKDPDPKLTLKPVVRLTRLSAKKLKHEEEFTKAKGQPEKTLMGRTSRKSVRNKKYADNSVDDDLSVNECVSDDYIASEQDQNSSDDDSDYKLKSSTPVKHKITTSSSRGASARALKRARGRPRIYPERVRTPRLKKSLLEKLINWRHWGVWKHHTIPDQLPLPVDLWQESHGKHAEFIVSNTCEVLKEDIEKTMPTAGKGTFANPHWTYSDVDKGPIKCVCPACGLTFVDIDELLQHRDKSHREYLSMCVICAKPIDKRINMAPHLATHCSKDQLEEFFETEMTTMGKPTKGSFYRLYKCQKCHNIFVGSKAFYIHKELCAFKSAKSIRKKTGGNCGNWIKPKPFSFIKTYTPSSSWTSNCKVCEKPVSSEYMSLHLRTHFNFEEQKEYVRDQQNKIKAKNEIVEKSVPGKDRTDVRIEQLKTLLEALERKNGKVITNWTKPKPTLDNKAQVIKKETPRDHVKRDGNYGPVQCAICGKVLATVYQIRRHEIAKHEGGLEKKFECSICHRPFGRKDAVSSHTPTHFNLEEQEKYSVWTGSLWEFLERLNSGEDLSLSKSKPPTSTRTRGRKVKMERRRIRKKHGRPRKNPHLHEDTNVLQSGGDNGSQGQSQPNFSGGAEVSTFTISSTAEVRSNTLHWNQAQAYAQGQQEQDTLEYFEPQNI